MANPSNNNTAQHVYIRTQDEAWTPATLISQTGKVAKVQVGAEIRDIDLSAYPNKVLPLQNVDSNGQLQQLEDMTRLPFLHEVCSATPVVTICSHIPPAIPLTTGCHFVQSERTAHYCQTAVYASG